MVVDGSKKYEGKTLYLSSSTTRTLKDIAKVVSEVKGRKVEVKVVGRDEYVEHYVEKGKDRASVEWWVSSYKALEKGECDIKDGTFSELLNEETVMEMLAD